MIVRLRLPAQGKGKEREDSSDDEPVKGLFDEILTPEDRDTSRTGIIHGDKLRFERSRQAAEVSLDISCPWLRSEYPFSISYIHPNQKLPHPAQRPRLLAHQVDHSGLPLRFP